MGSGGKSQEPTEEDLGGVKFDAQHFFFVQRIYLSVVTNIHDIKAIVVVFLR